MQTPPVPASAAEAIDRVSCPRPPGLPPIGPAVGASVRVTDGVLSVAVAGHPWCTAKTGLMRMGQWRSRPGLGFAGLLRQLRDEAGLTQEELAEAAA